MAILFSQADGSDQHYDTYEEFEQAFILLKRLNGEKVPQDLLDEAKAKYGDNETNPVKIEIDEAKLESEISEAVRDVGEELGKLSKARMLISDECGVPEKAPKFEVGDKVKVVENKSGGHVVGTIGEISGVRYIESQNRWSYEVNPISGHEKNRRRHHSETDLNIVTDSTEFRDGDFLPEGSKVKLLEASACGDIKAGEVGVITEVHEDASLVYAVRVRDGFEGYGWVRRDGVEVVEEDSPTEFRNGDIVRATEDVVGFGGHYVAGISGGLLEVQIGGTGAMCLAKDSWKNAYVSENLANIELVCRKEDRKDIEL